MQRVYVIDLLVLAFTVEFGTVFPIALIPAALLHTGFGWNFVVAFFPKSIVNLRFLFSTSLSPENPQEIF